MEKPQIDEISLKKACKTLDIKLPIKFRWQGNFNYLGMHKVKNKELHRIIIRSSMNSLAMNKTIWHELTHAAQYERYGEWYFDMYEMDLKRLKIRTPSLRKDTLEYRSIPLEAEAYYNEERYGSDRWLLK